MDNNLSPETIVNGYCRATGVAREDVIGPWQTPAISRRRHELMYLLRQMTPLSQGRIGHLLGGRDQTTVQQAVACISDRIVKDPAFADRLRDIAQMIRRQVSAPLPAADPDVHRLAALGVLADRNLSDADARQAALTLLSGGRDAR